MRKSVTVLLSLLLLFSFTFGVNTEAAKHVAKMRAIKELALQKSTPSAVKTTADPGRIESFRARHKVNQMVEKEKLTTSRPEVIRLDLKGNLRASQNLVLAKTQGIPMPMDTLSLIYGASDTVQYFAGQPVFIFIMAPDTVWLEFFVDNGDGILGPGDMRVNDFENDKLIVLDGEEPDQTPFGDGVVAFVMNTNMLDGPGAYFGLQGFRLFILAHTASVPVPAEGVIDILPPDENTSISGSVRVRDTMVPLPQVAVWAMQMPDSTMPPKDNGDDGPWIGFVAMTDVNGNYRIEIPDMFRGKYVVGSADIWGLYPGMFPTEMKEMDVFGDLFRVDIFYQQANEHIFGIVTDNLGQPVPGIVLFAKNGPNSLEAVTDSGGHYDFAVMPGWWWLGLEGDQVFGQYMKPDERNVEVVSGGYEENFTLYIADGHISGQVLDASGTRLSGVEVMAFIDPYSGIKKQGNDGGYYTWTLTDFAGNYNLAVSKALQGQLVIQPWDTMVTAYNVWAWVENGVVVPNNYWGIFADTTGLDFVVLNTNARLSGRIFEIGTNKPLLDANVRIWTNLPSLPYPIEQWYWTGGDGYYEFDLIGGPGPAGYPYNVEVFYPYEWQPSLKDSLNIASGDNLVRDYYINRPTYKGRIEGHVYRFDWTGIEGARVEFYGPNYYERYTGPGGYYVVENVDLGWYSGTAYAPGFPPSTINDIQVGNYTTWVDFWMGGDTTKIHISGTIKEQATGNPIPGAVAFCESYEGFGSNGWMTDSSGYYEFFIRPGTYDLGAGAPGFWAVFNHGVYFNQDTVIDFALNRATIADTLIGSVVDDMSNPLRKVFIFMISDNYLTYTATDFNGVYKLPLPAGNFHAVFTKENFRDEFRDFTWPGGYIDNPLVMYPVNYTFGPQLIDVMDVPMDQGKQVRLTWKRAESLYGQIKEYQIWRAIEPLPGPDPAPNMKLSWDYITTVPVHADWDVYNYVAPTLYDKVKDNIHWTGFMVTAIGWDGWSYWDSNIRGGWSEDNLPPGIPKNLAGTITPGGVVLKWDEVTDEPVKYYTVYRKVGAADFAQLGYSDKPEYLDAAVSAGKVYLYKVTATDYGLNESAVSEPVNLNLTAIIGGRELPTEFALAQNFPNPFNPRTSIEFALPRSSDVKLTIYNLVGQVVQEFTARELPIGYHTFVWDGRDRSGSAVSGGVYIYTLNAGDFKQTKKMILMK